MVNFWSLLCSKMIFWHNVKLNTICIALDTICIAFWKICIANWQFVTYYCAICTPHVGLSWQLTHWYYWTIYVHHNILILHLNLRLWNLSATYWYYWIIHNILILHLNFHLRNLLILLSNSRRSKWFWKIKNVYIHEIIEQSSIFSKFLPTPPLPLFVWK